MSKKCYVISFKNQPSGESPYGQKGAYPLESAQLASGHNVSSGPGDKFAEVDIDHTYIFPFTEMDSKATHHNLVMNLKAIIHKQTTTKNEPDTITVSEVAAMDDANNYKVTSFVEHPKAVVRYDKNRHLVINSDTATVATIPVDGQDPTEKTELDFVNRRVNGS